MPQLLLAAMDITLRESSCAGWSPARISTEVDHAVIEVCEILDFDDNTVLVD